MAVKAGTVEVRRSRGNLVVNALASTPRGTKFINGSKPLAVKHLQDKNFKSELDAAINELIGSPS